MENLKRLETFNKLEETLGKEATKELVTLFDLKLNEMKSNLATKADIETTKTEIAGVRVEIHRVESTFIKWFIGTGITVTVINILLGHFM
jgi:hypothetical protein